jgi:hypothetical protein
MANSSAPRPASFAQSEVSAMQVAWQQDPTDIGLIVYKPSTCEIHLGSFDAHGGHELLLHNLQFADTTNWRGASISNGGLVVNNSGLNIGQGYGQGMPPSDWQQVLEACRQAGLTTQTS